MKKKVKKVKKKKKIAKKKKIVRKAKKKKAVRKPKSKVVAERNKRKVTGVKKTLVKEGLVLVSLPTPPAGKSLEEVGKVTHYFSKVEAAVVKLTKGSLSLGDTIIIKGHTTEFQEKVGSIQLDHVAITNASIGQEIGLEVKSKVREHDAVYKVIG